MYIDIFSEIVKAQKENRSFVLVTIIETKGAVPRQPGCKMLVNKDGTFIGTVGGGITEKKAIDKALECLQSCRPELVDYAIDRLDKDKGMTCGGNATLFFEPFHAKPQLVLCGGGHVAGMAIPLANEAGFETIVIDTRDPKTLSAHLHEAAQFNHVDNFEDALTAFQSNKDTFFLICTFSHQIDCNALKQILQKEFAYVGMIGSREKIKGIFDILIAEGVDLNMLKNVHTPIGLDIGAETPFEIAIAIIAEMIMVKNGGHGQSLRDQKGIL